MEAIEILDAVARECFRSLAGLPDGRVVEMRGAFGAMTPVPLTFFNGIATSQLEGDVDSAIAEIASVFRDSARPFRWWISPSAVPGDLAEALGRHGLRHVWNSAGMVAGLSDVPFSAGAPEGVSIRRVTNRREMATWARVLERAFQVPHADMPHWLAAYDSLGYGEESAWSHFVAWLADQPVATTSVLHAGKLAGVYHVATMPAARGRGIGAALTREALRHARSRGATHAALQSSEMGLRVYQSAGFREVCQLSMYDWRP